ncbi:hypothetical protein NM208_g1972 [Fusarium decemcellulare]|uniref:Uncharacterized protein n=1 Tax=Fusarium decemcellulare TaxID=57161 RepID=A0ACC1SUC6_9HYPO|nr:hypothetical protein NM208_g1972 [Fusarium decemcellulare]
MNQQQPEYTAVFRTTQQRRIKRNRPTVSCSTCRTRKLKCDRQHPCGACQRRGEETACQFDPAPRRVPSSMDRQEIQRELIQMRNVLRTLADQSKESGSGTSHNQLAESINRIESALDGEKSSKPEEVADTQQEPDAVFGFLPPATVPDILKALPSRQCADRILATYFNASYVAVPCIHVHQFRRQYEAFWKSPASSNLLWVSILFSILATGVVIHRTRAASTVGLCDPAAMITMSARCLLAGQYLKADEFSVEALIMHAHSRYTRLGNRDATLSPLCGLTVRLAQQRGYHRDPSELLLTATPFVAEMRRRVWFVVQHYDVLFSFEQGLPPLIHEDTCHPGHPTNITDDDFDEDTQWLSPRSLTEAQNMLPWVYQSKLIPILRRIISHALGFKTCTYPDALFLASELEMWHTSLPPCLRIRPIRTTSFTDPNHTVMHRAMLELMYMMGKSILYRPFVDYTRLEDFPSQTAMNICRRMALRSVGVYIELDREMQAGGRLHEDRYITSHSTTNDFLVSKMIAPLEFADCPDMPPEESDNLRNMLYKAMKIWSERAPNSAHALEASRVLRVILTKVRWPGGNPLNNLGLPQAQPTYSGDKDIEGLPEELDLSFRHLMSFDPFLIGADGSDLNSTDCHTHCETLNETILDPLFPDIQF